MRRPGKLAAVALLGGMLAISAARAEPTERERGEALYADGLRHLREGRPERALAALDASAELLPSPNTDLLRAHALRAIGRRVDALVGYERVVRDAGARVRAGDARFEPTLAEAGRWVAFLRTALAELSVEIDAGERSVELLVDGQSIETVRDARTGVARARIWREPGRVRVGVRAAGGGRQQRDLELAPGESEIARFELVAGPKPPKSAPAAAAPEPPSGDGGPPIASFVAWGVGGAGLVVLAVAGGLARARMAELDDCRPNCSESQVNDAETKATVANVGLVVGIAGAVTGGAIWLGAELMRPAERAPSGAVVTVAGSF